MFEKTREVLRYHANEYDVSAKVWKELKDVENGVKKLLAERKQFKADAELGRAVRLALHKKKFYMKETGMLKTGVVIETEKELLEWARNIKGDG
jgi:hypothetical protein